MVLIEGINATPARVVMDWLRRGDTALGVTSQNKEADIAAIAEKREYTPR